MSEPRQCDDTSSGNTPNTLPLSQTEAQNEKGKNDKKGQKRQQEIESEEGGGQTVFQPLDLKSLTFKPIGKEQEVDVWHATPHDFHAYVSQYVSGFLRVNTNIWPLAERLALLDFMWWYSQVHRVDFPFAKRQQVVPDVDAEDVPLVDAPADKPASQAKEGA